MTLSLNKIKFFYMTFSLTIDTIFTAKRIVLHLVEQFYIIE